MAVPRILVVEDDPGIASGLERALTNAGYAVGRAGTGTEAVKLVESERPPPDLVLLDLGLPDADGFDVCRRLVQSQPSLPVIVVTARTDELDVVAGLDAGAVDYVTKPFRLAELLARVRAHLRQSPPSTGRLSVADIEVDVAARRVWRGAEELDLRPKEFDLLVLLASNAGKVVTRARLMTDVWDEHWYGSTKTLDVHISAVRRKIAGPGPGAVTIATIRGVGYRLEAT
ncbi:MAG TPA: response regulator transcription factor [Acidimicrobiales bacterium]